MEKWLYQNTKKFKIGRQLQYLKQSPGKRHYWGYRGKDYGFFTTQEQKNMENPHVRSLREHRSLTEHKDIRLNPIQQRSERFNHESHNPHQQYPDRQFNESRSFHKRYHTEGTNQQYQDQVNPQNHNTPRRHPSKLLRLDAGNNKTIENPQKNKNLLKLNSNSIDIRLPEIKKKDINMRMQLEANQKQLQKLKIKQMRQLSNFQKDRNKERNIQQNVFFYGRKNRKLNPTFCNSYMYPLPYYQHV